MTVRRPEELEAKVRNAIIEYPGSKWRIAHEIISLMPEHHSYLEPFFGSGAVLFRKKRSPIETVNDLDNDVVNFFEWVKTDPEKLAAAIHWTPYARQVYEMAWAGQHTETDSFRRAVNFCARMMQGHGFRTTGEKVGWKKDVQGREYAYAAKNWCKMPEVILEAAERLRGVQIDNRSASELVPLFNFPDVLIYADPPYVLSTRHRKQYRHEMDDADHEELLTLLKAHKGPVILSGYESGLYDDALQGWYRIGLETLDQRSRKRREILWMNFEPARQETLWEEGDQGE